MVIFQGCIVPLCVISDEKCIKTHTMMAEARLQHSGLQQRISPWSMPRLIDTKATAQPKDMLWQAGHGSSGYCESGISRGF